MARRCRRQRSTRHSRRPRENAEDFLVGIRKVGDQLFVEPAVPASWPEMEVSYRVGSAMYLIQIERPGLVRANGADVTLDGMALPDGAIPLRDDGQRHTVRIVARG